MLTDFHDTTCDQPGYDNSHVNVIEVDGGRDNELVFRVDPPPAVPPDTYFGVGDRIRITLRDFRIPADGINQALIGLSDSNPANTSEVLPSSAAPATDDPEILVLTLPDLASLLGNEGEHLIITIGDGTGILAPQIPKGFHDPTLRDQEDGYPVEITFVDASGASPDIPTDDENFVVVKNPVSSTEPGATVRVDLATYASEAIGGNEEITVDFSGPSDDTSFDIPHHLCFQDQNSCRGKAFDPADVLVEGERVVLTVPDNEEVPMGDFVISFNQLVGPTSPESGLAPTAWKISLPSRLAPMVSSPPRQPSRSI